MEYLSKFLNYLKNNEFISALFIAGFTGAVISAINNKKKLKQFLWSIPICVFSSVICGLLCKYQFQLHDYTTFALCGLASTMSHELLGETKELVTGISEFVKNWLKSKFL